MSLGIARVSLVVCVTALLCVSAASGASILTPYNVIVSGSFTDNGADMGGGLYAGGTASFTGTFAIADDPIGETLSQFPLSNSTNGKFDNTGTTLVVVGGVIAGTAKPSMGNFDATGSVDTSLDTTGAITATNPTSFADTAGTSFATLSTWLASQPQTSGDTVGYSNLYGNTITTITVTHSGPNYVNLTATELDAEEINFVGVSSTAWVIVNVDDTADTFGLGWGTYVNGTEVQTGDTNVVAEDILYNFSNATNVYLGGATTGSVLAPNALVTGDGNQFDGSLIAASFNSGSSGTEFHNLLFGGSTFTPEPAPIACVGLGLLALEYIRKRRRA
ncbi:MAG: collagen-binding domain-containing protein [Bryobacteraceae bacterium]